MICTWAVVKVSKVNSSCETAMLRTIENVSLSEASPAASDCWTGSSFLLFVPRLSAHTPDSIKIAIIGMAIRNSSKLESVQYRNRPRFLIYVRQMANSDWAEDESRH